MNPGYYAAKAAQRVFADRTIWWRAAALSAVQLIPFLGALIVSGYTMIVMREAAWSVDHGLPRFSERREILRRGLDGFVVSLVWSLPLIALFVVGVIGWTVSMMPALIAGASAPKLPWWFGLALVLPTAVLMIFVNVALLRAAVYLKSSAGLSLRGVRQLIGMNRERFRYVAWLPIALALVGLVLSLPVTLATRNPELPTLFVLGVTNLSSFLVGLVQVPLSLVVSSAYGLWAGETDPATWPPVWTEPVAAVNAEHDQVAVGENPL